MRSRTRGCGKVTVFYFKKPLKYIKLKHKIFSAPCIRGTNWNSQAVDCTDRWSHGSLFFTQQNMAPILKSVSASLSRLHRYWSGKQHLEVIKVICTDKYYYSACCRKYVDAFFGYEWYRICRLYPTVYLRSVLFIVTE